MHLYGAQLVCFPLRSFSVSASAQMTRDTHVFVAGSHDAFDAQSSSVSHLVGQSTVPLHLYPGHVGDSLPAARGVHWPGVTLQTPQPPQSVAQHTVSTQARVAHSSFLAQGAATAAPDWMARARRR